MGEKEFSTDPRASWGTFPISAGSPDDILTNKEYRRDRNLVRTLKHS